MAKKKTNKKATKKSQRAKAKPRKKPTSAKRAKPKSAGKRQFLSMEKVESLLPSELSDQDRTQLIASLGEDNLEELQKLFREKKSDRLFGHRGKVFLLPGILGSTIGTASNLIWIDPVDLAKGHFTRLKLPDSSKYSSQDIIPLQYALLKLRLELSGYDVEVFHYDWRHSLEKLGQLFAKRLKKEKDGVRIVAHSMGGLVSRVAMKLLPEKQVSKLIMLGTPNYGSFAPVLVVRENHDTVWTFSKLDVQNETRELAETFNTFDGLMQMMPREPGYKGMDLFNRENWPSDTSANARLRPDQSMMEHALEVHKMLLPADDKRCHVIVGVNQETVVGVELTNDKSQFIYKRSLAGDGTVPIDCAVLDKARTYFIDASHTGMVHSRKVAGAVKKLLQGQKVTQSSLGKVTIQRTWLSPKTERSWMMPTRTRKSLDRWTDSELRELAPGFISARHGNAATDLTATEPTAPFSMTCEPRNIELNNLILSRRKQERFEINLAYGDVSQLKTRALVLGMFQAVKPTGPAAVLDQLIDGTISEFVDRRMFGANVGEIQIIPTNRQEVRCELIVLAGLGAFDEFSEDVMRRVAENVGRCLLRAHIDEIGTVLVGSNSKLTVEQSMRALLGGFFNSIKDSPERLRRTFRGVTVCEFDQTRFQQVKNTIYGLASTGLFENHEVVLDEMKLESTVALRRRRPRDPAESDPVYLIARSEGEFAEDSSGTTSDSGTTVLNLSVLRASGKGAVVSSSIELDNDIVDKMTKEVAEGAPTDSSAYGQRWADLVLPNDIREVLLNQSEHHLAVVHDRFASKIPWETLHIKGTGSGVWSPADHKGVSRRYLAQNMAAAAWLNERRQNEQLEVLLVIDPTSDLSGAAIEGQQLKEILDGHSSIRITEIFQDEATKERLKIEFSSGKYDVVHYAGHAYFDKVSPSNSGIICAGHEVLNGRDLLGISNLPSLMFFNACEAARVRKRGRRDYEVVKEIESTEVSRANSGLAEAFLRGGVANYVGTFWPVNDDAAKEFARAFYTNLLNREPIEVAVQAGRKKLKSVSNQDWANYILFGDPWFKLRIEQEQMNGHSEA